MSNRRQFLKQASLATAAVAATTILPKNVLANDKLKKVTILHTNDLHCHINPFSGGGESLDGKGGMARLSAIVNKVRREEDAVFLFDCGDMFQGTPFFNQFKGELILKVMSKMKYDAATIGNHEFDNGLEQLVRSMNHAKFPFVNSNYDFTKTPFYDRFAPYNIFTRNNVRVGVYGLGINPAGLVDPANYAGIEYNDPITIAQETEELLKKKMRCDLIVCLSHLGFEYTNESKKGVISDKNLAPHTKYTDIILGGHTHTFLEEPYYAINADGKSVVINQAGWGGLYLGRLDIYFDVQKKEIASLNSVSLKNEA